MQFLTLTITLTMICINSNERIYLNNSLKENVLNQFPTGTISSMARVHPNGVREISCENILSPEEINSFCDNYAGIKNSIQTRLNKLTQLKLPFCTEFSLDKIIPPHLFLSLAMLNTHSSIDYFKEDAPLNELWNGECEKTLTHILEIDKEVEEKYRDFREVVISVDWDHDLNHDFCIGCAVCSIRNFLLILSLSNFPIR